MSRGAPDASKKRRQPNLAIGTSIASLHHCRFTFPIFLFLNPRHKAMTTTKELDPASKGEEKEGGHRI